MFFGVGKKTNQNAKRVLKTISDFHIFPCGRSIFLHESLMFMVNVGIYIYIPHMDAIGVLQNKIKSMATLIYGNGMVLIEMCAMHANTYYPKYPWDVKGCQKHLY